MDRHVGGGEQYDETSAAPEDFPGTGAPFPDGAEPTARPGRRVALIAGAVVVGILILGGGAFAVIRMLGLSSVDPADRLPDSVAAYAEVNLDPSFDQTPKLFDIIDTFGGFDELDGEVEDFDGLMREALQDMDVDFLEPSDLTSWVGTRAAVAGGATEDVELYGVLALASRDDEAAESAMTKIVDEANQEFGYVVDDGLVTVVFAESDPQSLAETLVADGRESPLSGTESFAAAKDEFDGDQILLTWYNLERYFETMDEALAQFEDELADEGSAPVDLEAFEMAGTWFALGAAATENGIDITYHSDGATVESEIATDWLDRLGDLPSSQAAGVVNLPDGIDDGISSRLDLMDAQLEEVSALVSGETLPNLELYTRGQWQYDLALTADELAEWDELVAQYEAGEIAEGDADFDRLVVLDDRYYTFGTRDEYDEWVASGGESTEQWMYEQALTHDEYRELDEYDTLASLEELPAADEERYFALSLRMYRYGLVSDYDFHDAGEQETVDVRAMIEEIAELVSGSGVVFALEDVFANEPAGGVAVTLEEGPAERVFDLPQTGEYARELADELGDDLVLEGPTITIGELTAGDETLAEHADFNAAFDGAPDEALWAVFVDIASLNSAAPEPQEWLEPVRSISWVNGNRSGLIRILID